MMTTIRQWLIAMVVPIPVVIFTRPPIALVVAEPKLVPVITVASVAVCVACCTGLHAPATRAPRIVRQSLVAVTTGALRDHAGAHLHAISSGAVRLVSVTLLAAAARAVCNTNPELVAVPSWAVGEWHAHLVAAARAALCMRAPTLIAFALAAVARAAHATAAPREAIGTVFAIIISSSSDDDDQDHHEAARAPLPLAR